MNRVHHFPTGRHAFNACYDDPHVREGDVLVVAAERIVGLASTDPFAVTTAHGDLRSFPAMDRERLLAELVHDAHQITFAVEEALRHHFPVARHFLAFAGPRHALLATEATVVLHLDDVLVTSDAIDRRITALQQRVAGAESGSSLALFTERDRAPAHSP